MNKATIFAAVVFFTLAAGGVFAQKATVDARINTAHAGSDPKDYFNWSGTSEKANDRFDPLTGASANKSTVRFDTAVFFDAGRTRKNTIPVGLRGLLLFAIAPSALRVEDDFAVTENGSTLVVTFVHRGVVYRITTDSGKNADLAASFQKATVGDILGGIVQIRPEFLKAGGNNQKMADLDMEKVRFTPDIADADASRRYTGKVKIELDKTGVLSVKGSLAQRR